MAVITQPLHIFRVIPESVEANARIRTSHDLGDKVHIYKRLNSSSWQCASYLAGKNRRTTTKGDSLSKAKEFAEGWYLQLRGKLRDGGLKSGMFPEAANLMRRRESARMTIPAFVGKRSSFTITFFSQPIQVCVRTRRCICNSRCHGD
jgi:hypothetical protein